MSRINQNIKIGVLGNFNKDEFYFIFNEVGKFLKANQIDFYLLENDKLILERLDYKESLSTFKEICDKANVILSIGGDGTIISSIRKFIKYKKPILGLHIGGLGFLAESNKENYQKKILDIKAGNYYIEDRMLLNVSVEAQGIDYNIVNELVLDRRDSARTIKTNIVISDKFANTYESDGIIFSTPTGSTAYSLSAGGPIVYPSMEIIIITPICPHTLSMRPLIIPSQKIIDVSFSEEIDKKLSLTVDGQIQEIISSQSKIAIKKSNYSAYLVKFKDHNYFKTLRKKMSWRGNLRIK